MRRTAITLLAVTSAIALAGCSSSSGGGSTASGGSVTTAPASSSTSPPAASPTTTSGNAVATALDPCQLVIRSEASSLAGVRYGPGKEETSGKGKECVYGAQTTNVFTVEVGQDASSDAAKADWNTAQAQAKALVAKKLPPGVHVALATGDVSGVGDEASSVYGSAKIAGTAVGFSGFYALDNSTFFAFQDLAVGKAPPSVSDMTAQAKTTASRVS